MKAKYLIFSIVMTAIILVCTLSGSLLYRWLTHTSFRLETYTFSLVAGLIVLYYYDVAEKKR